MRDRILYLYALAILLGFLTGLVGTAFQLGIRKVDEGLIYFYSLVDALGWPVPLVSAVVSMVMVVFAWLMVKKIAPEAAGSGVQEIEGTLLHERGIFWRRLLPVKFLAGILAISAKLVMGREGPTIQMGGNLGEMLGEMSKLPRTKRDTLIASGAAAGLATAFNAPLAGVLFVLEEMRNQFNFSFTHFKMVAMCCVTATITLQIIMGSKPAIPMDVFQAPALGALWLFLFFGFVVGLIGLGFNVFLMGLLNRMDQFPDAFKWVYVPMIGLLVGALFMVWPETVGGGYGIIQEALTLSLSLRVLLILFCVRFVLTLMCYSTSVPGGIFAPMLALGTLLGLAFEHLMPLSWLNASIQPGMFAVAGMGALFAAAVRAPVTGIILVVEMTQNYALILPLMVTCLMSTTVVQLAGNPPIYTQLLTRTMRLQKGHENLT